MYVLLHLFAICFLGRLIESVDYSDGRPAAAFEFKSEFLGLGFPQSATKILNLVAARKGDSGGHGFAQLLAWFVSFHVCSGYYKKYLIQIRSQLSLRLTYGVLGFWGLGVLGWDGLGMVRMWLGMDGIP